MFTAWMSLSMDAAFLGLESQRVIGLRLMKIAGGGPGSYAEAHRMITEKTTAFAEAAMTLAGGGSTHKVLRRYRTHVRANERRLSRPER